MTPHDETKDGQGVEVQRKKRLSRKEQKARKKQRTNLEQVDQQKQQQSKKEVIVNSNENNHVESKDKTSKKKKSKKKKNKKNKNKDDSKSQEDDDKIHKTAEASVEAPSSKATTKTAATVDPWKPQDLQEDIPYVPTPLPAEDAHQKEPGKHNTSKYNKNNNQKTLGKWFPKARVMKSKSSATNNCTILLFYQYKSPDVWGDAKVATLIRYLQSMFEHHRGMLGGRLRVAPEGINATLSCGDAPDGTNGRTILEHFTRDLQQFDAAFEETDFKFLPAQADRHFKDLKILPVQELVFYGFQQQSAPLSETGVHLAAQEFHNMLGDTSKETVVIDVRNHYEAALGRFDGQEHQAQKSKEVKTASVAKKETKEDEPAEEENDDKAASSGAKYIDPLMRKSTDFASWLEKSADDLKGKRVMLYCTGGVRCERASAYLNKTMGEELDGVYQLQGGVERYLQTFPDGGFWRGRNFVFDKREAVSAADPNGDGGVLPGKKKKKHSLDEGVNTKCCLCEKPWDRYVGKRKCDTCGVPVLMCDTCMSSTKDSSNEKKSKKRKHSGVSDDAIAENDAAKDESKQKKKLARCDLCMEQNITVRVEEVEYTDNGVKSKSHSDHGKAAPSVLKWGGGHAAEKKERRRKQPRKGGTAEKVDAGNT